MGFGLRFPSTQLALACLAIMLFGDLVGLWLTGMRIEGESIKQWGLAALSVGLIFVLCGAATWRLRNDRARGARLVSALSERIWLFSAWSLLLGAVTTAGAVFSYVMASAGLPFQDAALTAVDRWLGFNWLHATSSVCGTPWLESALAFAYRSSMGQVAVLVLILAMTGQRQRLSEFVALFALTGGVICILSAGVPAEAAFFHFSPSVICPHVRLDGTLDYHKDLLALRAGLVDTLVFKKVTGIVTFPSFHTALAVVVMYCAWRTPFIRWPAIGLNIMVIMATMPLGGHYLFDVLVGGSIALSAIMMVRALNRRRAAEADGVLADLVGAIEQGVLGTVRRLKSAAFGS